VTLIAQAGSRVTISRAMVEILLIIIAIGVLLLSREGKAILGSAFRLGVWVLICCLLAAILVLGGWLAWESVTSITDKNAPKILHIFGVIVIVMIIFPGYELLKPIAQNFYNKIGNKFPIIPATLATLLAFLMMGILIFAALLIVELIGFFIGSAFLDKQILRSIIDGALIYPAIGSVIITAGYFLFQVLREIIPQKKGKK
jgi:hypothetical protein